MEDEGLRTPTRSEIDTFKILANPEFASLRKNEPSAFFNPVDTFVVHEEQKNEIFDDREERPEVLEKVAEESPEVMEAEVKDEEAQETSNVSNSLNDEDKKASEPAEDRPQTTSSLSEEERLKLKAQLSAEIEIEKESLLYEIEMLEKQGLIKLQRKLSMEDTLEAIQYQYDRANMIISTQQTVEWSKNGIKMGSTMLETLARRFGVTYIDGFSNNLCKDMNKFNAPLTKMVRKYWRRGSSSPEMELGMIVFSSLAMTVMQNKGGLGASKEPKEPSNVRPPSFSGLPGPESSSKASVPVGSFGEPKKMPSTIPEWARSAMNAPLPKHFAAPEKPADTFPEFSRGPPAPIYPVIQTTQSPSQSQGLQPSQEQSSLSATETRDTPAESRAESRADNSKPEQASVTLEGSTKKLTLASPRSSRRKRETSLELNLDS